MFTGIVADQGEVESVTATDEGVRIRVRSKLASELSAGDSIAVGGACLTATAADGDAFEADVMNQTLALTTLGGLDAGDPVNLELPLRAEDRLGGHVVQGHVDGTATVAAATEDGFATRLRIELPEELAAYVVERGSIALEGVSLTIADLGEESGEDWIEVSLIPETLERTTLGAAKPGARLNVECDVLARYVRRMLPALSGLESGPGREAEEPRLMEGS